VLNCARLEFNRNCELSQSAIDIKSSIALTLQNTYNEHKTILTDRVSEYSTD
jgi:hypothetical protein